MRKNPGGVLYSLAKSFGVNLAENIEYVEYDRKASRISEALDSALDAVADDFFGSVAGFPADVKRNPAEPDESFRTRIQSSLLLPAATRQSVIDLLTRLVGIEPRVLEPWRITDTCAWGKCYWGIDTKETPFRWGNPGRKYQAFVESQKPTYGKQGNNPIYGFGAGWAWGTPTAYYFKADPNWFLAVKNLDSLINKTKVFGTTVWRKYFGQILNTSPVASSKRVPAGSAYVDIEVFPMFSGAFSIVADTTWNSSVQYEFLSNSKFRLSFSNAPPDGDAQYVDWIASPITYPGSGAAPVVTGTSKLTLGIPSGCETFTLFAMTNWNTNVWMSDRTENSVTLSFDTPAPDGASFSYLYVPPDRSGQAPVATGENTVDIPISIQPPFEAFILPTWNTSIQITKSPTQLSVSFGTAAPDGAQVNWAINKS